MSLMSMIMKSVLLLSQAGYAVSVHKEELLELNGQLHFSESLANDLHYSTL